jgi:hypothetical protein
LITGGGGSRFAPDYIESWRYMFEMGFIMGPWRISGLYAYMPGPDKRHGVLIDRQPYITDSDLSAQQVFGEYSIMMAGAYGSAVGSSSDLAEANTFGARLDFALAANLVSYASFVKVLRSSYGYGYGYIRPDISAGNFGKVDYGIRGSFTDPSPAIPTRDVGWELDMGIHWQLLEGWVLGINGAYFHPGEWFKYACIDKSVPGWDNATLTSANNFGANSDRVIDPVFQLGLSFSIK